MKKLICSLLLMVCCLTVQAQTRNKQYDDYIKKYRDLAVQEMKKYHIPASITLAQGLLESGAGKSTLARKSNNHFGIKCGSDWRGKTQAVLRGPFQVLGRTSPVCFSLQTENH